MADEAKARLGLVLWSAFQCSTFAEMSGNKQEQARLFEVGVKAGREFLEALKNRQISPEAASSEVPIGVTMRLQGPSTDFIVGRIFESAAEDAFNKIVKQKNGMPLEISDWIRDEDLQKSKASNSYLVQNCRLIQ